MQNFYKCLLTIFLGFILQGVAISQSQQYLHFDGEDDFIEVPEASKYIAGGDQITMAGWFYHDEVSYGQGLMSFRNGGTGDGEMYIIQLNNGQLECRLILNGVLREVVTGTFTVLPEQWQHFAWVYDGAKVEMFVDGVSKGSTPHVGIFASTDTPFSIGNHISPWNFLLKGSADEVTLWNKALTANDLQTIMTNELNGDEDGLQLYYKMNQGVPGEDNTTISSLISSVEPGVRDGILQGFNLNGNTSNFLGEVNEGFQVITFGQLDNKLISDDPFDLQGESTSGLPLDYQIVSGPASISGNTITLDGIEGEVVIRASQAGNAEYDPAEDIENVFQVIDPNENLVQIEGRSPIAGNVMIPNLGPMPLACIAKIDYPELFSVDNVQFVIDGEMVEAKEEKNGHYTGWWTPTDYGTYSMDIISSNNFGASNTETVLFTVVNEGTTMTANAGQSVWLDVNTGYREVEVELPSFVGAFDKITGHLDIACPPGGCDPWDRIVNIGIKGHNGEWYEIIRYISPYGVACNSEIDFTDFASLLHGKVTMYFEMGTQGNGFEYSLDIDYSKGTPEHAYSTISKLWYKTYPFGDPGNLQPTHIINAAFPENTMAAKIKLVSSGHGWGENNTGNAAEFHQDKHHIWVNDAQTFEQDNWYNCDPNPDGCQPQNGTWYFDRAGWCPGAIAQWFDYDMTPYIADDFKLQYVFNENYVDFCHANNPNCVNSVTCANCNDGFNPSLHVSSYLISLGDTPLDAVTIPASNEALGILEFDVYPNPADEQITIQLAENAKKINLIIRNQIGKVVLSENLNTFSKLVTLNTNRLVSGLYYLEINSGDFIGTQKLIIK